MKTPKKLVSCHNNASVAEQTVTKFNGDGGEHSHTEKRRVEGESSEDTKKVSFMSQQCKTSLRHAGQYTTNCNGDGVNTHTLKNVE